MYLMCRSIFQQKKGSVLKRAPRNVISIFKPEELGILSRDQVVLRLIASLYILNLQEGYGPLLHENRKDVGLKHSLRDSCLYYDHDISAVAVVVLYDDGILVTRKRFSRMESTLKRLSLNSFNREYRTQPNVFGHTSSLQRR